MIDMVFATNIGLAPKTALFLGHLHQKKMASIKAAFDGSAIVLRNACPLARLLRIVFALRFPISPHLVWVVPAIFCPDRAPAFAIRVIILSFFAGFQVLQPPLALLRPTFNPTLFFLDLLTFKTMAVGDASLADVTMLARLASEID
jgi:hypothetical protein